MLSILYLLFLTTQVYSIETEVTFKNVELSGYSVFTLKFKKTITSSDSLKDELPSDVSVDHLEIVNQNIPVLRKNSVSDIEDLDELTIRNSKLKEIQPGAFKNLPLLRKLTLKGNELEQIRFGVFNYLQLSMLDLGQNKIKNIEADALSNLPNLLNINLADNLITSWNERWFYNDPLLTRISMQNNSLEKIPDAAFINLNGNKKFGSVKLSLNLVFSYNQITEIEDDAFQGLNNINNLWLDNNKLTDFSDKLLENVEVEDLRIGHNKIRCLKRNLNNIIKAQNTDADGNPFDCTCLDRISKWAKEHGKKFQIFFSEMSCTAERLQQKVNDLKKRLNEVKDSDEREETTRRTEKQPEDEVEVLFK